MSKIIKYCNEEYHINSTSNIQIGTLNYYRFHTNNLIADPLEGISKKITLNFTRSMIIPKQTMNYITMGMTNFPHFDHPIKTSNSSNTIVCENGVKFPNIYIFCCALEEKGNMETAESLGYDSFYTIDDAEKFSKIIAKKLKKAATLKNHEKDYKIKRWHQQIRYNESNEIELTNSVDIMHMIFNKIRFSSHDATVDFSLNNEYRFAWMIKDTTNTPIEVADDPLHLSQLKEIRQLCNE